MTCPKSRCRGCEPAALESESSPRCPPGPVPDAVATPDTGDRRKVTFSSATVAVTFCLHGVTSAEPMGDQRKDRPVPLRTDRLRWLWWSAPRLVVADRGRHGQSMGFRTLTACSMTALMSAAPT